MRISDNGTDREMTAAELATYATEQEMAQTELAKENAAKLAKQVARQAVLDKLGLTANEAAALFG
jgi:hypothetical protein